MSVLAQRLLSIDAALDTAGIAHAFGGAIALAYNAGTGAGDDPYAAWDDRGSADAAA